MKRSSTLAWTLSCVLAFTSLSGRNGNLLPPQEFPDRASAVRHQATHSVPGLSLKPYSDADWAQSWFSELPAHLKSTKHSPGFNLTRGLGRHFTTYTVEKILKADSEHASSDFTILDLGSGAGVVALALADIPGWHIIAVDPAEATLQAGRDQAAATGKSRVEFVAGSHRKLPVADGSMDAVLAFQVLELIPNLRAACQEIHRVLKPGGALVFGTVNRSLWSWFTHVLLHERLFKLIPAGLQDWRLFIRPSEIKALLEEEGFGMLHEDLAGLCQRLRWHWDWTQTYYSLEYFQCSKLGGHYMAWAYKVKHADSDAGLDDDIMTDDPKAEL